METINTSIGFNTRARINHYKVTKNESSKLIVHCIVFSCYVVTILIVLSRSAEHNCQLFTCYFGNRFSRLNVYSLLFID